MLSVAGKQGEELSSISIRGQRSNFLQGGYGSAVSMGNKS